MLANRLFNTQTLSKMVAVGVDSPIKNLAVGMEKSLSGQRRGEDGKWVKGTQDHIANNTQAQMIDVLNLPVYPFDSFKNKPASELPDQWIDEYGFIYRKKKQPKKPFVSQPRNIRTGY